MAKEKQASPEPEATAKAEAKPSYRVSVACPTPLAQNPCDVAAANAAEAWEAFCQVTGITGTDHPKTIEAL